MRYEQNNKPQYRRVIKTNIRLEAPLVAKRVFEGDATIIGLISPQMKMVEMRVGNKRALHSHRGLVDGNGVFTIYIGDSDLQVGEFIFLKGKGTDGVETEECCVQVWPKE